MSSSRALPAFWLKENWLAKALAPLGAVYGRAMRYRRQQYLDGRRASTQLPTPILVVGNIFVGGTGKTPLVIWLVEGARQQGMTPGVILRGYGGTSAGPESVQHDSDPQTVGDEAVLIAQRTGCAVAIGKDRVAAAQLLIDTASPDLIISDDGLQHYALARDIEIAVIDGERGLGNGRCLPAGPLRECPERLKSVDLVIANGPATPDSDGSFTLKVSGLQPLSHKIGNVPPVPGNRVHAVAGIGNPQRFFSALTHLGFDVIPHRFADHHAFKPTDLQFGDQRAIIMTEKDAVKCRRFAPLNSWSLPVMADPEPEMEEKLMALLASLKD
ncbi:MAG: tetraacyldisaccharide 4'-kinase [Gammaproteobacteria bacterium]|nr:tetraacyldisaccharide 4'-kinase [Gammaproteobacteria bacterium]